MRGCRSLSGHLLPCLHHSRFPDRNRPRTGECKSRKQIAVFIPQGVSHADLLHIVPCMGGLTPQTQEVRVDDGPVIHHDVGIQDQCKQQNGYHKRGPVAGQDATPLAKTVFQQLILKRRAIESTAHRRTGYPHPGRRENRELLAVEQKSPARSGRIGSAVPPAGRARSGSRVQNRLPDPAANVIWRDGLQDFLPGFHFYTPSLFNDGSFNFMIRKSGDGYHYREITDGLPDRLIRPPSGGVHKLESKWRTCMNFSGLIDWLWHFPSAWRSFG